MPARYPKIQATVVLSWLHVSLGTQSNELIRPNQANLGGLYETRQFEEHLVHGLYSATGKSDDSIL